MSSQTPGRRIIVYSAALILTFLCGFVAGGIQKVYEPEDCNAALREESGTPDQSEAH